MTFEYVTAIVVVALAGWAITGWTGGTASTIERAGLSVWVGLLALALIAMGAHVAGLPIRPLVYGPPIVLLAGFGMRSLAQTAGANRSRGWVVARPRSVVSGPLVVVGLVLLAVILLRTAFLPNRVYDSITSFDLLAIAIAAEDVFRVSLFDHTPIARGGSYPPFLPLTLAWGYDAGLAAAPQALTIPIAAFFVWLAAVARRFAGPTTAAFVVVFALVSPDLNSYIQHPIANMPVIVFAAVAFVYLAVAVRDRSAGAAALVAAGTLGFAFSRADAMAIWLGIAVATVGVRGLSWTRRLATIAPALLVTVGWQAYVETSLGTGAGDRLFAAGLTDPARVSTLVRDGAFILFNVFTMGFAPWLFVVGAASSVAGGRAEVRMLAAAVAIALLAYTLGFAFVDPDRQDPLAGLLRSTYKRGLTAFVVPMTWVFVLSPVGSRLRRAVGRRFG